MAGSAPLEPMQPPNTASSDWAGCLEVAILLGRRIDDQAIWHEGRCAWVGATPEEGRSGETVTSYATLGPDLYGGSGGIAIFLAELASATGDGRFRRTAKGAIAHALARASELPANLDRSLYSGRLGITVAAAAVGTALGDAEPLDAASRLIAEPPRPMARDAFDIMSGRAGAIYGLLWLSSILGDVGLRKEVRHGRPTAEQPREISLDSRTAPLARPARCLRRRRLARVTSPCSRNRALPTNVPFSTPTFGTGRICAPAPERPQGAPAASLSCRLVSRRSRDRAGTTSGVRTHRTADLQAGGRGRPRDHIPPYPGGAAGWGGILLTLPRTGRQR